MRIKTSLLGDGDHPSQMDLLSQISAVRDRLHADLAELDRLIGELEASADRDRRALERYELGEILGATDLGRLLGVSRDTARRYMTQDFADLAWTDERGRIRVRRSDVERWLADRSPVSRGD